MTATTAGADRRGKRRLLMLVAALAAISGVTLALILSAPEKERPLPTTPRSPELDDSGYYVGLSYALPVTDPLSLEHIRDCYQGCGDRGIRVLRQELAQGPDPEKQLRLLMRMAQLHLYEGEFAQAGATLKEARALAEGGTTRLHRRLPTLIFLQGVAALRQGETENCIECGCASSCILPIRPEAVHQKPEGASQAVRYFSEYLQLYPEDVGVRWLLNLAYMTLGGYPERVPREYLVPLTTLQSEFDIGRFVDVAPRLGVNRLSRAGGAIMDDFDNDGLLDLVETTSDPGQSMAFYRNRGDGTFEDRTLAAGLDKQLGGLYCVQTDYNNDGWLDIYICRGAWWGVPQRHSLLRNNRDGTFTDVTAEAGLDTPIDGQVAAWADYDNDGWLDLFVGGETGRSRLYHNRGDGTFEEVALQAGVANRGFMCKGASWGDFDGDGYPDLYVSNFGAPPRLFHNNRDGTFTDVAPQMGITRPVGGFSCWFWDYDNDGWPDIFAATFDRTLDDLIKSQLGGPFKTETCRLYRNLAGRGFEDVTEAVGLAKAVAVMGSNFADLDNDGFLDFYLGTGDPNYSTLVPKRLFKNVEGKRFADITLSSGTGHLQKGHAVACGDWDRDGNVDMYVNLGGAAPGDRYRKALFQNPGQGNHWITVKLVGKKTNRPAIGARIKVTLLGDPPLPRSQTGVGERESARGGSERAIYRHVTSGSSFGANALQQTIGIGKARKIATLEIFWPTSKTTQVFRNVPIDQAIEVTEFEPTYRPLNWSRIPVPK